MEFKPTTRPITFESKTLASSRSRQVNLPATVFTRTPTRQRHVVLQAAARTHTPVASAKKLLDADPHLRLMSPPQWSTQKSQVDTASMRSSRHVNKENSMFNVNTVSHKQEPRCLNHPKKVGTYETKDEHTERFLYCEKCAILLASQGFKVSKLARPLQDRNERAALRKAEISTIHELTQESLRFMSVKQQQLIELEQMAEQSSQDQLNRIDEYFGYVHQLIEHCHDRYRTFICEEQAQSKLIIKQVSEILEEEVTEIRKIQEDVALNDQQALKLSEEHYTPIIQFYKLKLSSYRNSIRNISPEDILPKQVDFRRSDELVELFDGVFNIPCRNNQPTITLSKSKRLRGKASSMHFSFETDQTSTPQLTESVIPEEQIEDTTNEQNLLDSFIK